MLQLRLVRPLPIWSLLLWRQVVPSFSSHLANLAMVLGARCLLVRVPEGGPEDDEGVGGSADMALGLPARVRGCCFFAQWREDRKTDQG